MRWRGQRAIQGHNLIGLFSEACLHDIARGAVQAAQVSAIIVRIDFPDADAFAADVGKGLGQETQTDAGKAILDLARTFYREGKVRKDPDIMPEGGFWAFADKNGNPQSSHFNITRNEGDYPSSDIP